jgi:hypothetical protein
MEQNEDTEEEHMIDRVIESGMTMVCPECEGLIEMENGMMICGCGFAPNHGAD